MPKITLYPVILLLFGLGMPAKVAFGALHGIIPVVLFTMNAVRNVNRSYLRAGRALRLTPAQTAWFVLVPATLPEIFSGLRIGFSLTLLGTMLGELFASQRGLGFLLMTAIDLHDVKTILAIAMLISIFAVAAEHRDAGGRPAAAPAHRVGSGVRHEQGNDRSRSRRAVASPDLPGAGRRHRHVAATRSAKRCRPRSSSRSMFSVSRITVRRAMSSLQNDGLIERGAGRRTDRCGRRSASRSACRRRR